MKKLFSLAMTILLLFTVLALTGCGQENQDVDNTVRTITDITGRTVKIPTEIDRVACQSSTCEAVIISLGKATKLVGTTDYTDVNSFAFKLFPELEQLTKLADDMSVEEMLENNIQVVIVKDENKIEKYEEAGLPVICVDLDTVSGTKDSIKIIGEIVGATEQAEKCVNYINDCEQLVSDRFANAKEHSFTAYYSRAKYAESNLLTTYAAGHIYSEWIKSSGGTVITQDMELAETKGGVLINGEELISANPDVIFIGGYYRNAIYADSMSGEYSNVLNAIKNKQVYMVPTSVTDWSVGGCELGLTTLWCAQLIAPDLFSDIDMTEKVISFYKEIADIEVSESLADDILNSNLN